MTPSSPKILLATTSRWFAVARLTIALKQAGFCVEAVCPSGHPVIHTSAIDKTFLWNGLLPEASIRSALLEARPELVIPCDDLAAGLLHKIYRDARREDPSGSWLAALLERSLGDPESFRIADARSSLIALAAEEGIRVPKSKTVEDVAQLKAWIAEFGLPAVLKTDGSSGGVGVKIVSTPEEAYRAFHALNAPPAMARVAKRAIVDRDINLLKPFLLRERPLVNVQSLVRGHDATMAVACWQGKILAALSFDVLQVWEARGPASVLRWKDDREMSSAAEKIVARLKLSGLYGFDFMVEDETGDAYLIEMNPRATQTCHLPLGTGRNLAAALWSAVRDEAVRETASVTDKETIALFPQEWQRDPGSAYLSSAYHDVPWDEPELVRACIRRRRVGRPVSLADFSHAYLTPRSHT